MAYTEDVSQVFPKILDAIPESNLLLHWTLQARFG